MKRGDIIAASVIGAAVGILVQPVLSNTPLADHLTFTFRFVIFLGFLVLAPLALFIAYLISKVWPGIYQFAKFAAVGTLNSFIDLGVFNLETVLYGTSNIGLILFATFKAISFLCGTTNSFFWNKFWTFSSKEKAKVGQVAWFYGIAIAGWILNVGIATLVKSFGPTGSESAIKLWVNIVSPLCGIAASFIWNYIGYKYFVFKKPAEKTN